MTKFKEAIAKKIKGSWYANPQNKISGEVFDGIISAIDMANVC
jgi:hypothetical protein